MTNDDPDLAGLAKLKHAHQQLREQIARIVVAVTRRNSSSGVVSLAIRLS